MNRTFTCRIMIAAMSLPLLGVINGCRKNEPPPPAPPEVQVITVEPRDVPVYREWVGTLEAEVNATIIAQISGYLLERDYVEGKVVRKGDLLFQIDDRVYRAEYDRAMARLGKTELDVKRLTPLARVQAVSQQELDDAIQDNLAAKAAVESAQLNLDFCKITAPVDGVAGLASEQAQIGNLVGPNSGPLTTVATLDPIRAYCSVSQAMLQDMMERHVAEGKTIRGDNDSDTGPSLELVFINGTVYPYKGRVRFSNNQLDVRTGTIRVAGEFPNPQRLLVPGMFVRIRALLTTETNALVVPQRSVIEIQGRQLVAVVGADNKVSIRPVQAGERFGSDWVVAGKLRAGERVVVLGVEKVRDGILVNPVPFEEKTTADAAAEGGKN